MTPKSATFAAQINGLAERVLQQHEPDWTDFLDPSHRQEAEALLRWIAGIRYSAAGGYPQAERRRLLVYPDYYINAAIQPALAFLEISAPAGEALGHRDYQGALLGLGLKPEKLGDLLPHGSGCQLILVPELADYIKYNLTKVGPSQVTVREIDPEELNPPQLREKLIRTTVASLRLDAIAALGFGDSRSQIAREIKADRVKLNWQPVKNPDRQLQPGDLISLRGRGRVLFREVTGQSKKGRPGVILVRYF